MTDDTIQDTKPGTGGHPLLAEAVTLHENGKLDEAASIYRRILAEFPRDFDASHLLGVVSLQQGRYEAAQKLIYAALSVNPHDIAAMGNLGTSYLRDGQLESALPWFEMAVRLQPESEIAVTNLCTTLRNMGRDRDAIPLLRAAYSRNQTYYPICNLLGACLVQCGEVREAVNLFQNTTRLEPDNAEGWANLSVALNAIGEQAQARECADRAVSLKPHSLSALGALGAAQFDQGRLADAIDSYRQGVALPGPSAQLLLEFANALMASGLNDEAIIQLERAVTLDAKSLKVRWALTLAHVKPIGKSAADVMESRARFIVAMDDIEMWCRSTSTPEDAWSAVGVSQPFYLAYQPINNRELLGRYGVLCARWMATLPRSGSTPNTGVRDAHRARSAGRKLRLGIAAAHIQDHSVWNAITKGWVDHLDRTLFEIHLFQLEPVSDQETERARKTVTHFEDKPTSLIEWVNAIEGQTLDVLIYPEIGMDPLTIQLAALRLAPVQAASWGHPESTGLPTMDIYISGDELEPAKAAENYSESLLRLPNLGVYVEPLAPAVLEPSLRTLGLPDNEPLLLCPGSPFKYSPLDDDVWVEIASQLRKSFFRRSSGGRLVFFRSRSDSMDRLLEFRLRAAFDRGGVDFDSHVSIIALLDRPRFFGLMKRSALMLDTIGFSGFNTAIQGIECDLPVLAYEGEFMRGRLASAIMRRLDLPELVATTKADFVKKAVDLAGDAGRRKMLRVKIKERRNVLFYDLEPVRALEQRLADAVYAAYKTPDGMRNV